MRGPSDGELAELLRLTEQVKLLDERIDYLRDLCRARGSHCTEHYVVAIMSQSRTSIAPLREVEAALTREVLELNGLIRESKFTVVKVSPKTTV